MNQLVINGITDDPIYHTIESKLEDYLQSKSTESFDYFRLRDMAINYCTGCWSCWYKTPGRCALNDDHEQILSRIPHSDKILFVSPILMGYESSLLKTCKDRNIRYKGR